MDDPYPDNPQWTAEQLAKIYSMAPVLKMGDRFTMDVTIRRKWWQIWKPRTWTERRAFNITNVVTSSAPTKSA